jgi:hypothetical protein
MKVSVPLTISTPGGRGEDAGRCLRNFRDMSKGKQNRNNNKNHQDNDTVNLDSVVIWAMLNSGAPVPRIAQKFSICPATVYNRAKKVQQAIERKIDMEQLKAAVLLCYPAALESLIHNLQEKHSESVTNNFLNKTVWRDVTEREASGYTKIFNLPGLGRLLTPAEINLLEQFASLIESNSREESTPPVDPSVDGPSKREGPATRL